MCKFRLENNRRFYEKCVEEGKYPKEVMEAVVEELDLRDYEVVLMGNGAFVDVYDTVDNTFLGLTTKRDIIDYAIETKENWLKSVEDDLEEELLKYNKDKLEIMKRGLKK